jgi:hypothetical protein
MSRGFHSRCPYHDVSHAPVSPDPQLSGGGADREELPLGRDGREKEQADGRNDAYAGRPSLNCHVGFLYAQTCLEHSLMFMGWPLRIILIAFRTQLSPVA